jgi:hypothetical protein
MSTPLLRRNLAETRGGGMGWANLALVSGCARLVYDGPVYAGETGRAYRIVPHCEWPQAADAEQ